MYFIEKLFEQEKAEWITCLKEAKELTNFTRPNNITFFKDSKNLISIPIFLNPIMSGFEPRINITPEICMMRTTKNYKIWTLSHELAEYNQGLFKILLYKTFLRFLSKIPEQKANEYVYNQLVKRFGRDEARQMMFENVEEHLEVGFEVDFRRGIYTSSRYQREEYDRYIRKYMPLLLKPDAT